MQLYPDFSPEATAKLAKLAETIDNGAIDPIVDAKFLYARLLRIAADPGEGLATLGGEPSIWDLRPASDGTIEERVPGTYWVFSLVWEPRNDKIPYVHDIGWERSLFGGGEV